MAADSDSTGKTKNRNDRRSQTVTDEHVNRAGPVDVNGLETIPTAIPREGDGYRQSRQRAAEQARRSTSEPGFALTEEDLRRINTRKGIIELLENRGVDIQEVLKTLLYEQ
jgi:polyphosphate kinase